MLVETISTHPKDKKLIGSSQHGSTKMKSHLTNLTSFYKEVTSFVDGKSEDAIYPDFRCCLP